MDLVDVKVTSASLRCSWMSTNAHAAAALEKLFVKPMKAKKNQAILIVDADVQFREGLYNFLLSAGYNAVDATKSFDLALEKIKKSAYDIVLSDAGSRVKDGLRFMESIASINPKMRLILMIRGEDQLEWEEKASSMEFQFLIKPTFPLNLLYLLQ